MPVQIAPVLLTHSMLDHVVSLNSVAHSQRLEAPNVSGDSAELRGVEGVNSQIQQSVPSLERDQSGFTVQIHSSELSAFIPTKRRPQGPMNIFAQIKLSPVVGIALPWLEMTLIESKVDPLVTGTRGSRQYFSNTLKEINKHIQALRRQTT